MTLQNLNVLYLVSTGTNYPLFVFGLTLHYEHEEHGILERNYVTSSWEAPTTGIVYLLFPGMSRIKLQQQQQQHQQHHHHH